MLQNIVPISLYVTTEFVKLFQVGSRSYDLHSVDFLWQFCTHQAYFISKDLEMYYEPIDVNCVPKTWNIADDLGKM